uniref:Uncharacterized protein n=1 Tax=Anguilla anguilla TaxID=7936 RepID=A0A0E9WFG2_ANGAN
MLLSRTAYTAYIPHNPFIQLEIPLRHFRFSTSLQSTMAVPHLGIKPATTELQTQFPYII